MHSLLIVDDEIYAVNGIKSGLDWSVMGFNEIHEAYDGNMAREIIDSRRIDVMICDIEMPGSSGLDLLEWVNERNHPIETIFLTCHSDFSYARKALQLGSLNYLLKPVDFVELESIVMKALNNIARDHEASNAEKGYRKYLQLWETRKPLMLEKFWQELLDHRGAPSEQWIHRELAGYETTLAEDSRIFPVLISIEKWHKEIDTRDEEIMEYALRNAAKELILGDLPGIAFQDRDGMIVVLAYGSGERTIRQWMGNCEAFVQACAEFFYSTVACYLGKETEVRNLTAMYKALQYAEQNNVRRNRGIVCYLEPLSEPAGAANALPDFFEWAELLEPGRAEPVRERLTAVFERLERESGVTMATLSEFYQGMQQMLHYLLHKKRVIAPGLHGGKLADKEAATRSVDDLRSWAEQVLEQYEEAHLSGRKDESPIDKAKRYIGEHLTEEVSREQIADHVFLNPGYLSRLFKKETGESLSDYILRERMTLAKNALAYSDEPISKVARSLGYNSLSYFGKTFKRFHGTSPQDFRNGSAESDGAAP